MNIDISTGKTETTTTISPTVTRSPGANISIGNIGNIGNKQEPTTESKDGRNIDRTTGKKETSCSSSNASIIIKSPDTTIIIDEIRKKQEPTVRHTPKIKKWQVIGAILTALAALATIATFLANMI